MQAGFRKGYSSFEQVFNLKCLTDLTLTSKKKLYCGFVDFIKDFDTVWQAGLRVKVLYSNITGKCFNVIYNLYQKTKSCISLTLFDMGGGQNVFDHFCAQTLRGRKLKLGDF